MHKLRPMLVAKKLTRAAAEAKSQLRITDQVFLFNQNTLSHMFKRKTMARAMTQYEMQKQRWRSGR